ncbi:MULTISPECIES: enoyl-CoA hydratase/isomerase family protein [Streptomyces]|uniref:3-hydroxyisobutyryl-CoA hydrolase n=1 Tax=Streptomyces koelreuteriae TaxID=2838015 RepID=A0ABX8FJE4_9ACTN|nr:MULTISPECIES: enoyl-CoA hydratase/isomerase family protein [Streptomyces]QWB21246.1 enoyl-CoA hydratase/isomerase family protein [Streptomyces koelreuteriae]UUA04163.1 enoyl-CoA hydratase/isomerase family protein [Streptomyces koelreuteriae]UUA11789.1 enoyl-CoA hydratase/isomerase family protein [Streptomyces sp. CRCS-T-1]
MTDVLFRTTGRAAHIVLDRPKALNALTHGMVRRIDEALTEWERDPAVETVVITGAGERGLCAGGDIRGIHDDARDGDGSASGAFWRDEYHLNARIARYPKPYVAVMDGIVMGGGVGVSAHGSVRIVTERSRIAMPETGIGFVPDVGGTYLLALAPGELGTHLALTGAQIGAGDALLCGLADHYVPSEALERFVDDLAGLPVREALDRHVRPAPEGELAGRREWIDSCFASDTVEEIVQRLLAHGDPAAKETAETLLAKSPTALKVTLTALRRAGRLGPLERVLEQEYRVSCAALSAPDLVEGIRAQVIDKDRNPRWSPATLDEVTDADVERFFAPLGERELGLAGSGTTEEVAW